MTYSTLPLFASFLLWGFMWGILCLVLCAARLATAPRLLGLAALACVGHACALVLPPWPVWAFALNLPIKEAAPVSAFAHPPVAWVSKVVGLLWSGLLVYGLRWVTPAEVGLRSPKPGTWSTVGPVVGLVAGTVFLNAYFSRHSFTALWLPEQLYYATLPGLEEELFYRGVLLALLSRVFPRTIWLPGTRTSWGGLVAVLLFTLGHVLKYSGGMLPSEHSLGQHLVSYVFSWLNVSLYQFRPGDILPLSLMGTLLLWVRERTGSCWAAVATHCLLNTCLALSHNLA